MTIFHLHIGSRFTGITVVPDDKWPSMWRVRRQDGRLSDMVNLTRAKDAAIVYGRPRGLGSNEIVYWHRRESLPQPDTDDILAAG